MISLHCIFKKNTSRGNKGLVCLFFTAMDKYEAMSLEAGKN